MIVEIGHFALVLAFALSLVQFAVPLAGTQLGDRRLVAVAGPSAVAGFALTALSFVVLTVAYVESDFSVANVWENSHSAKPMLYKITGVWGNHEGSMLLWVLILSFFGALVAWFGLQVIIILEGDHLISLPWVPVSFTQSVIPIGAVLFIIAELLTFPERLAEAWRGEAGVDPERYFEERRP